jgi:hypothetical protein
MVSCVVYRLLDLVELFMNHMGSGGDESLEQATRNSVSLPANGVYRPRVYRPMIYWLSVPVQNLLVRTH